MFLRRHPEPEIGQQGRACGREVQSARPEKVPFQKIAGQREAGFHRRDIHSRKHAGNQEIRQGQQPRGIGRRRGTADRTAGFGETWVRSSVVPVAAQQLRSSPKPSSARIITSKPHRDRSQKLRLGQQLAQAVRRFIQGGMGLAFRHQPQQRRKMACGMQGQRIRQHQSGPADQRFRWYWPRCSSAARARSAPRDCPVAGRAPAGPSDRP